MSQSPKDKDEHQKRNPLAGEPLGAITPEELTAQSAPLALELCNLFGGTQDPRITICAIARFMGPVMASQSYENAHRLFVALQLGIMQAYNEARTMIDVGGLTMQ